MRWTLDEARRQGHAVAVRTADGSLHAVADDDTAARWSAIASQAHADAHTQVDDRSDHRAGALLHRELTLRIPAIETETTITGLARWSAAAAAFASMAMLIGALGRSAAVLGLVLTTVALGAVMSSWVARRSGRRPLVMQVAIWVAVLVALAGHRCAVLRRRRSARSAPWSAARHLDAARGAPRFRDDRPQNAAGTPRDHLRARLLRGRSAYRRRTRMVAHRLGYPVRGLDADDVASTATARRAQERPSSDGLGWHHRPMGRLGRRSRGRHVGGVEPGPDPRRPGAARTAGAVGRCSIGTITWRARTTRRDEPARHRRGREQPRPRHDRRCRRLSRLHRDTRHERAR